MKAHKRVGNNVSLWGYHRNISLETDVCVCAPLASRLLEISRARVCTTPAPQSPSPKLETSRSLIKANLHAAIGRADLSATTNRGANGRA